MFFRAIYLNKTTVLIGQIEGLPDIKGTLGRAYTHRAGQIASEAFTQSSEKYGGLEFSGNDIYTTWYFAASRSNPIYGKSIHVTPINASVKIWQRIS